MRERREFEANEELAVSEEQIAVETLPCFPPGCGKVENIPAVGILIGLGARFGDVMTRMGSELRIWGAAAATRMQQPPRARGHLSSCVWGRGPSASAALQNLELNAAARGTHAGRDADTSLEM